MSRSRVLAALLVIVAVCILPGPRAGARADSSAHEEPAPRLRTTPPAAAPAARARPDTSRAGKSVSDRLFDVDWVHENLDRDAARDRQIASLHETVARLSHEHDEVVAVVTALLQKRAEGDVNGPETQG